MSKPILCLDFDGVIHSYTSGWKGADVVSDPPVPFVGDFIHRASDHFNIAVYSSRSGQPGGIPAMQDHVLSALYRDMPEEVADAVFAGIAWPLEKPPAMVTIDDRAITFTGEWPSIETLQTFKPWNKS